MGAQGMDMLRWRAGWLSTNLLERQLMYIVAEYIMACWIVGSFHTSMKLHKDCQSQCIKQPQMPFPTQWAMPPNLVDSYTIVGMLRNVMLRKFGI